MCSTNEVVQDQENKKNREIREIHQGNGSYFYKKAAKKAVETKTAKTVEWANSISFNVPTFSKDELEYNAVCQYEQYNDTKFYFRDDEDFINRICTNYLRHECTTYDRVLNSLYGLVGRPKAYEIIKEKVNQEIKQKHKWIQ